MISRGHKVFIACGGGEMQEEFRRAGIVCWTVPLKTKCEFSPGTILSVLRLLPLVKEHNIDIIHCNTRVTQIAGCLLSRYSGRPYVSTCHGFFKRRPIRLLFPCWGARVIAISEQVKEHLIDDFKVDGEKICLISHGIDIGRYSAGAERSIARKKFALPQQGKVVGIIARLSDVKGHAYLIRAMPIVLKQNPEALLWIIGTGPMKRELEALVSQLKIGGKVLFTPQVRDTASALAAMDIFVMPSVKEGLGLALMEAMAAGLAVVASDVGGIRTLIRDGQDGLLAPVADQARLARQITCLLADPSLAHRLGTNARARIAADFAFETMINETEKVYRQCLNQKN